MESNLIDQHRYVSDYWECLAECQAKIDYNELLWGCIRSRSEAQRISAGCHLACLDCLALSQR